MTNQSAALKKQARKLIQILLCIFGLAIAMASNAAYSGVVDDIWAWFNPPKKDTFTSVQPKAIQKYIPPPPGIDDATHPSTGVARQVMRNGGDDIKDTGKKYSPYGAMALHQDARYVHILHFRQACDFDANLYTFDDRRASKIIIKNHNSYPIYLRFIPRQSVQKPQDVINMVQSLDQSVPPYDRIKIPAQETKIWHWQFKAQEAFDWLCYRQDFAVYDTARIQLVKK